VSEPQLLPGNPFDIDQGELPSNQLSAKLLAEQLTAAAVMPFEAEKQFVNRDHVAMQRHIWGLRDDHGRPIELSTDGRKA
jgi:hypothetical protein